MRSELQQSTLPLCNVDSALLAVDDNSVVDRLEIETFVGTIDMEVRLTGLGLICKSCQNAFFAGGNLLNKRVLLREHERSLNVSLVTSNTWTLTYS